MSGETGANTLVYSAKEGMRSKLTVIAGRNLPKRGNSMRR